eukprot:401220-Amphidinium_carterae.1
MKGSNSRGMAPNDVAVLDGQLEQVPRFVSASQLEDATVRYTCVWTVLLRVKPQTEPSRRACAQHILLKRGTSSFAVYFGQKEADGNDRRIVPQVIAQWLLQVRCHQLQNVKQTRSQFALSGLCAAQMGDGLPAASTSDECPRTWGCRSQQALVDTVMMKVPSICTRAVGVLALGLECALQQPLLEVMPGPGSEIRLSKAFSCNVK